jgi:outer membrane protein assembly factor BamB
LNGTRIAMFTRSLPILLLLPVLAPVGALAQDWPLFRGNPLETGVAASALPENLEVRWQFKAKDSVEGTAAIVHGTVYIGCLDEHLYALDLATGRVKWTYQTDPAKGTKVGPIRTSPAVRDGVVYIGDTDGVFHCVDAATGNKRWTFDTQAEVTSSASFAGDTILFGSSDENLHSLSKDGKERWKFKVPGGPVMGTPAIAGERTFAAGCDSTLHVLDTVKGTEVSGTVDLGGQVGATVAVIDDQLYVGTMSGEVLAVNWKKGEVLWRFEAPRAKQPFYASAAATDNLVIIGSRDKRVYVLDRKSGKEVWNFATKKKVDSSPVVAGQRVFVGSADGNLYVLDLASGKERQHFALGKEIAASPAIGENSLVIGTMDGVIYCIGAKK